MLRASRVNPNLSAYMYLFGNYDFNQNPLASFGSKVMIHNKTGKRGSWQYHADEGWYIGPSLDHYRCFQCFNPDTRQVVISDTVQLIEQNIPIPVAKIDEYLRQATDDILNILKKPQDTNLPFLQYGDVTKMR